MQKVVLIARKHKQRLGMARYSVLPAEWRDPRCAALFLWWLQRFSPAFWKANEPNWQKRKGTREGAALWRRSLLLFTF